MDDSRNLPDRRRRGSRRATVLLAATVLALLPEHGAYAATWSMTPTPNASQQRNLFNGVDAVNTTNAWAVGYFDAATAPWQRPLAARWNGTRWTLASPPTPSSGGWLNGVDGSAATNVWAVGAAGSTALIQRWNGTAWRTAPSPLPAGATSTVLNGVRTFGANSAWAVGDP